MVEEEEGERPLLSTSGFCGVRKRKKEGRERMSNGYGEKDEEPSMAVSMG